MRVEILRDEFKGDGQSYRTCCYVTDMAFIRQIAQTAARNRLHDVKGRLAK
jgi:hypothetical protein